MKAGRIFSSIFANRYPFAEIEDNLGTLVKYILFIHKRRCFFSVEKCLNCPTVRDLRSQHDFYGPLKRARKRI